MGARLLNDCVLARSHRLHVNGNRAFQLDAVVSRPPRLVRDSGAGDESLGGCAARVDTCAAEQVPLDHGHRHARCCEPTCQGGACRACSDDDCVEGLHHGFAFLGCGEWSTMPSGANRCQSLRSACSAFSRSSSSRDRWVARSSTSLDGIPLLAVVRSEMTVPATTAITMSTTTIAVDMVWLQHRPAAGDRKYGTRDECGLVRGQEEQSVCLRQPNAGHS